MGALGHHRLSKLILQEGSEHRSQLEQFIRGAELESLSSLHVSLLPLKFIPIVERNIEAKHSRVSVAIPRSSQANMPSVSLANRLMEFKHMVQEDPDFITTVAGHVDSVRNPFEIAKMFSLVNHPSIAGIADGRKQLWFAPVMELFYHCLPQDQLRDLDQPGDTQKKRKLEKKTPGQFSSAELHQTCYHACRAMVPRHSCQTPPMKLPVKDLQLTTCRQFGCMLCGSICSLLRATENFLHCASVSSMGRLLALHP